MSMSGGSGVEPGGVLVGGLGAKGLVEAAAGGVWLRTGGETGLGVTAGVGAGLGDAGGVPPKLRKR